MFNIILMRRRKRMRAEMIGDHQRPKQMRDDWLEPVDIGRVSEESLDNVREVFDDGNKQRRP